MANAVGGSGFIVKDGYAAFAWGEQNIRVDWGSAVKAVTSTMLFFAIKEGKLKGVHDLIDPYVGKVLARDLIAQDRSITFHHLANMISGYALPEPPGTAWSYNDVAISLYTRILFEGVYGKTPKDVAMHPDRLGPLQFQDGPIYESRSGHGLLTTPRDFARIGWFWLKKGNLSRAGFRPGFLEARVFPVVNKGLPS